MNTSAITASSQAPSATLQKVPQADHAGGTPPFGQVLSKEMADKNPSASAHAPADAEQAADKPAADSASTANAQADERSTEDAAKAATEQILIMAMHFPPLVAATSVVPASASPGLPDADPGAMPMPATGLPQAAEGLPKFPASTSAATTVNPHELSGSFSDKADAGFGTTLKQFSKDGISPEAGGEGPASTPTTLTNNASTLNGLADRALQNAVAQPATDKRQDAPPSDLSAALAPMQQAATTLAQTALAKATDKIAPHVGTPAWNQAVGQKIVWMVGVEQQSASLTLNPPDLGPLQVVLSISSTQANASFYASQPEVRQAIESALPKLREMLGDAGIQLGQANVSAGTPQEQAPFDSSSRASHSAKAVVADIQIAPDAAAGGRRIARDGLIDTFA